MLASGLKGILTGLLALAAAGCAPLYATRYDYVPARYEVVRVRERVVHERHVVEPVRTRVVHERYVVEPVRTRIVHERCRVEPTVVVGAPPVVLAEKPRKARHDRRRHRGQRDDD